MLCETHDMALLLLSKSLQPSPPGAVSPTTPEMRQKWVQVLTLPTSSHINPGRFDPQVCFVSLSKENGVLIILFYKDAASNQRIKWGEAHRKCFIHCNHYCHSNGDVSGARHLCFVSRDAHMELAKQSGLDHAWVQLQKTTTGQV